MDMHFGGTLFTVLHWRCWLEAIWSNRGAEGEEWAEGWQVLVAHMPGLPRDAASVEPRGRAAIRSPLTSQCAEADDLGRSQPKSLLLI